MAPQEGQKMSGNRTIRILHRISGDRMNAILEKKGETIMERIYQRLCVNVKTKYDEGY